MDERSCLALLAWNVVHRTKFRSFGCCFARERLAKGGVPWIDLASVNGGMQRAVTGLGNRVALLS
jgi:hypothetical protein